MRNIIIALCLVALMGSCTSSSKCTSKDATKYLTNSLKQNNNLHKVQVQLVKDNSNECHYLYTVKTKEFGNINYIVTKNHKQWSYTVISQ